MLKKDEENLYHSILQKIDQYAQNGLRFRTHHGGTGIRAKDGEYELDDTNFVYPFYLFSIGTTTDASAIHAVRINLKLQYEQYVSLSTSYYRNKEASTYSEINALCSIGLRIRQYVDSAKLAGLEVK